MSETSSKKTNEWKNRSPDTVTVIFDQGCSMCRNFATMLKNMTLPEDIDIVPCGSGLQQKLVPFVSHEECMKAFMLIEANGTVLTGGDAASRAISIAPKLAPYAWMIRSKAGRAAAAVTYAGTKLLNRKRKRGCKNC